MCDIDVTTSVVDETGTVVVISAIAVMAMTLNVKKHHMQEQIHIACSLANPSFPGSSAFVLIKSMQE